LITNLKTRWQTCLAVPAAQRLIVNAANGATTLNQACATVVSAGYIDGGKTFIDKYRFILSEPSFTADSIENIKQKGYNDFDGKETFSVNLRFLSATNLPFSTIETFQLRNNSWSVLGDSRSFPGSVVARSTDTIALSQGNLLFAQDATQLATLFDPSSPSMNGVQSVRLKGPGLPTNGIVLVRSLQCGTSEFMAIHNKTGSLTDNTTTPASGIAFTTSNSPVFNLTRTVRVGSNPWPTSATASNYSTFEQTDPGIVVRPFSRYTAEYFGLSQTASTFMISAQTLVLSGALAAPQSGLENFRPNPSATFSSNYLSAFGSNAASQSSVNFEWVKKLDINPVIDTIDIYSSTRNAFQPDANAIDAFFIAPNYQQMRIASGASTATKTYNASTLSSGVSTQATIAAMAGAQNTTCTTPTPQMRALSASQTLREMTWSVQAGDGTQRMFSYSATN
jgi:hypothetical protein